MSTAAFTTLGCKVNQYETQKILESFEEAGFGVVPFDSAADVYVVNTCSVTSIAESKSRYTVRRALRHNPTAKVVVTGCAAQMSTNKDEVFEGADVLVPNPEKLDTLRHLFRAFPELERRLIQEKPAAGGSKTAFQGRTRATLKVQDGCSVMCSYCSIPYTRPGLRSRHYSDVLQEAQKLAAMGYREAVLTGVLIGAYGKETGSGGPDFESLVELLADQSGLSRIRISSIEMRQVTPRLIELLQSGKVVPHLHIPLQSGDTGVLSDMNRPYSQEDYLRLCELLYRKVSDLSLTTDIMVGFPTETPERFESTLEVCREARYLKAHVFRFSPRWGTPADKWGDPVGPQEKQSRSEQVSRAALQTGLMHANRFAGRTLRVLVENKPSPEGLLEALTDNYLCVRFAGPDSMRSQIGWVRIDEIKDGVLYGEIASQPASPQHDNQRMELKVVSQVDY